MSEQAQDHRFYLVPADDRRWLEYQHLCSDHYGYDPVRPDKTLFVSMDGLEGKLAAGCVIIHTDGPYVLIDGYVIDPSLGKRDKYNITVFCQNELKRLASMLNRVAVMLVSHSGLRTVLSKHGYERSNSDLWFYLPRGLLEDSPRYAAIKNKTSDVLQKYHRELVVTEEDLGELVVTEEDLGELEPDMKRSSNKKKRGWPKGKPRGPRKK